MNPRALLTESFHVAVSAADPLNIVAAHLPAPPKGRTLVIGAGKAAASMARAVELAWPKDAAIEGLVVTRYAHGLPTDHIEVVEAGHPVPDDRYACWVDAASLEPILQLRLLGRERNVADEHFFHVDLPEYITKIGRAHV